MVSLLGREFAPVLKNFPRVSRFPGPKLLARATLRPNATRPSAPASSHARLVRFPRIQEPRRAARFRDLQSLFFLANRSAPNPPMNSHSLLSHPSDSSPQQKNPVPLVATKKNSATQKDAIQVSHPPRLPYSSFLYVSPPYSAPESVSTFAAHSRLRAPPAISRDLPAHRPAAAAVHCHPSPKARRESLSRFRSSAPY